MTTAHPPELRSPPALPITKILAIGTVTEKGTAEGLAKVLPYEVRATVRCFLAGQIDQWFSQHDRRGVVFIMNISSSEEAHAILEKLPLGVAGMMEFQLIPLTPLKPLGLLLSELPPLTA